MEVIITIISVFAAVFFADIIWVFYIKYVAQSEALKASVTAVILYVLSAIVIIAYTSNIWYLVPASIGGFFGTYAAIKLHDFLQKRKENRK